ncbi:MAG: sugar transferase [Bryobacterales bacterium]|nr:sugar transferase [Bryobacterales bacterium]
MRKAGRTARAIRRGLDKGVALVALALLAPLMALVALAVLVGDGRPVIFRQKRAGRRNMEFELLKFRSMKNNNEGPGITAASDRRITKVGRFLRKYKLDELPQLWNVVCGEMSIVGPRPEALRYVDYTDERWRAVLEDLPGLTDVATLVYRHEEELLAGVSDPDAYYREVLLPDKLSLNIRYQRCRTLVSDFRLVLTTICYSIAPRSFDPTALRVTLLAGLGK